MAQVEGMPGMSIGADMAGGVSTQKSEY